LIKAGTGNLILIIMPTSIIVIQANCRNSHTINPNVAKILHLRVGIAARIWLQIVTQPDFRAEAKQQICLAFDPSRTVLSDAETEKAVSVQML